MLCCRCDPRLRAYEGLLTMRVVLVKSTRGEPTTNRGGNHHRQGKPLQNPWGNHYKILGETTTIIVGETTARRGETTIIVGKPLHVRRENHYSRGKTTTRTQGKPIQSWENHYTYTQGKPLQSWENQGKPLHVCTQGKPLQSWENQGKPLHVHRGKTTTRMYAGKTTTVVGKPLQSWESHNTQSRENHYKGKTATVGELARRIIQ